MLSNCLIFARWRYTRLWREWERLGCPYAQGYYFSRPRRFEDFAGPGGVSEPNAGSGVPGPP